MRRSHWHDTGRRARRTVETNDRPKCSGRSRDHNHKHHRHAKLAPGSVAVEISDETGVRRMMEVIGDRHTRCLELNSRDDRWEFLQTRFGANRAIGR